MIDGIKAVGVVGAGTMGVGIAQTFAVADYPVRLQDIAEALSRGMGAIKKSFERLVARGKLKPQARDAVLAEVSRLGRGGGDSALKTLRRHPKGRHYRESAAAAWASVILGGGWFGSSSLRRLRSSVSSGCDWV